MFIFSEIIGPINLAVNILEGKTIKFIKMSQFTFQKLNTLERVKMGWSVLKIFFSRITELISTQVGTMHHWGERF